MQELKSSHILVIVCLAVVLIFLVSRCKLSCRSKEGMSHRLPTVRVLGDNAYAKTQLPDYTLRKKWPMVLPHSRENYHDVYECRQKCSNVMGATPHADCVQNCMNQSIGQPAPEDLLNMKCADGSDCPSGSICVTPSYYGGGKTGYCMSSNEPGILEGFRFGLHDNYQNVWRNPRACPPDKFYNELMGECQPRFQGSSSARAIWSKHPDPSPDVYIPGSSTAGYGVGFTDPVDVPLIVAGRLQKLPADD